MPSAAIKRYWDSLPDQCVCGAPSQQVAERLNKHSVVTGAGCRIWNACKNGKGYGRLRLGGKLLSAHRVAYELFVGPIPDGAEIDHLCSNRACINPAHLEPVTHKENVARGRAGAWLSAKTHCPAGHPYSGENLYIGRRNERRCRACNRIKSVATNAKRKVAR